MIELTMKPVRSGCFEIIKGCEVITKIDCRKETNTRFELAQHTYEIQRESSHGDWVLSLDGETLCRATKPSAFSSRTQFSVKRDLRTLELKSASTFGSNYRVTSDDREVAFVQARGFFRRRGECRFEEFIAPPVQILICWLTAVYWARADDLANATPTV